MPFIRNAWYIAMWAERLPADKPVESKILGESLVIYRGSEGRPVALRNRCPHRSAPLHMGRVCANGNIECGYHGLQFNSQGNCAHNPHGKGTIPIAAKVKSYPVVEKHSLIWVWMGDEEADEAKIMDLSLLERSAPADVTFRDQLGMDANYELVIDNLLDLSHTGYLHRGVLGNTDTVSAAIKVQQEGDTVSVDRWMPGIKVPGIFDIMFRRDGGTADMWASITWHAPCYLVNNSGVVTSGLPREQGTGICGLHLLTPVDDRRTMYYFVAVRSNPVEFAEPIRLEIMQKLRELRRTAFETEDEPMIEAQQRMLDEAGPAVQPVLLEVDSAAVRYKRVLERLLAQDERPAP